MKKAKVALLVGVLVLLGVTAKLSFTGTSEWEVLYGKASAHGLKDEFEQAVNASLKALSAAEAELGSKHLDVGKILSNLSIYYTSLGKNSEATKVQLRSLQITEEILGSEHQEVYFNLSNLLAIYTDMGECEKGKKLLLRMEALKLKHKSKLPPRSIWGVRKCTPK